MDGSKNDRMKGQRKIIVIMLMLGSLVSMVIGLLVKENELKIILLAMGAGLLAAAFIAKAFSGKFGYKPTREEVEEKIFGK